MARYAMPVDCSVTGIMPGARPGHGERLLWDWNTCPLPWMSRRLVIGSVQSPAINRCSGYSARVPASHDRVSDASVGQKQYLVLYQVRPTLLRGVACQLTRSCVSGCFCSFHTRRPVSGSYVQALGLFAFLFA